MNRSVLAGLLFITMLIVVPLVIAEEYNAVEIKVWTNDKVYLDKVIPKDQYFHKVLHLDNGYTVDITYDPYFSGNYFSRDENGFTVKVGPSSEASYSINDVHISATPVNADFSTKAPISLGSIFFIGIVLVMLLIRRTGHEM